MLEIKAGCQNLILSCLFLTYQAVLNVPGKTADRGGGPDEQVGAQQLRSAYWKIEVKR